MSRSVNLPTDKPGDSSERLQVEQRRHRRIPANLNVQVTWIDAFGFENAAPAVVRDVSAGGFGIELRKAVPSGHDSCLRLRRMPCAASSGISGPGGDGFYLGLQILPSGR